ncbi:hypothetical protein I6E46_05265 [Prevotella loescheii]|nr:hypothetical protein [Hoylesella loescheii]
MKSIIIKGVFTLMLLFGANVSINAQGFLDKLKKVTDKVAEKSKTIVSKSNATSTAIINWDSIPVFHAEETVIVDAKGNPVLNQDGTQQVRVFLVDQNGNKRSAESVKAQIKAINKSIGMILAKVGGGTAIGALVGGGEGAAAGAAAGALASIGDIKNAKAQKKSLNQQKKLLAAYEKNFTAEGVPVNAQVDVSNLADLDLKPETKKSATAEQVMQELANADFHTSDTSAWEIAE